jgi:hypothetical protein
MELLNCIAIELKGSLEPKSDHIYYITVTKLSEKLNIKKPITVSLEFSRDGSQTCIEASRVNGDYLSFMDVFVIISKNFI